MMPMLLWFPGSERLRLPCVPGPGPEEPAHDQAMHVCPINRPRSFRDLGCHPDASCEVPRDQEVQQSHAGREIEVQHGRVAGNQGSARPHGRGVVGELGGHPGGGGGGRGPRGGRGASGKIHVS
eukprot:9787863-Alexandrium_andersonii.AAC.1